jgi:hypothetical protein
MVAASDTIMARQRPDTPSAEQRIYLSILRSVIQSSERPTVVVGRRSSGKSRIFTVMSAGPERDILELSGLTMKREPANFGQLAGTVMPS